MPVLSTSSEKNKERNKPKMGIYYKLETLTEGI
jgi:hypothetical protein